MESCCYSTIRIVLPDGDISTVIFYGANKQATDKELLSHENPSHRFPADRTN